MELIDKRIDFSFSVKDEYINSLDSGRKGHLSRLANLLSFFCGDTQHDEQMVYSPFRIRPLYMNEVKTAKTLDEEFNESFMKKKDWYK